MMDFNSRGDLTIGSLKYKLSKSGVKVLGNRLPLVAVPSVNVVLVKNSNVQYGIFPAAKSVGSKSTNLKRSSSSQLLEELNAKHQKMDFSGLVAVVVVIVTAILVFLKAFAAAILIGILGLFLFFMLRQVNRIRKSTIIYYKLDGNLKLEYQSLFKAFLG